MADFGDKGFGTLEPNAGDQEESISFTGVIQNANGTATLTGVSNVSFLYPYTETSGLSKTHAGGSKFIVTNTSSFYQQIINYIDGIAIAGAPNASTTVQGLVQEATTAQVNAGTAVGSTGAKLFASPADLAASNYGQNLPTADEKAGLGTVPVVNVYDSSTTWSKPSGLKYVMVEVVGGGGGSGGLDSDATSETYSGGGGGGGYSKKLIAEADLAATVAVTVGAGGTAGQGGSSPTDGGTGGTSSFGTHLQATGGAGSLKASDNATAGAAGGIGSSGDINSAGGGGGTAFEDGTEGFTGIGGSSVLGGGGLSKRGVESNGTDGGVYGGGAGGAGSESGVGRDGGAGGDGVVIVTEYYI